MPDAQGRKAAPPSKARPRANVFSNPQPFYDGIKAYILLLEEGVEARCRYSKPADREAWQTGFRYIRENKDEFPELLV